ncbi:MAG: tetratricopeptide repeat protein, partial [Chloroflexaceae bacterium]|nr:tetratricopeptide repeat protein [Chloroflexaceae bacterium]
WGRCGWLRQGCTCGALPRMRRALVPALLFVVGTVAVVAPWTARNYSTYGAPILIDTTGAENLWLDNDPAGREVVKAQLYAMGDDRAARQHHATAQGITAIVEYPQHFAGKAWRELTLFFALEYADDMRDRPSIWVPPAEVWLRLLLGDALWLLLLLAGVAGLTSAARMGSGWRGVLANPAWLFGLWALYTLLTTMIFHVELRYRLPLFPVLLPYAALLLVGRLHWRTLALLPIAAIVLLMLLHRPYPTLAWNIGWKHWHLAQAEQALQTNNHAAAYQQATRALAHDPGSALAQVAQAQALLATDDPTAAAERLRAAIDTLPAHPYAHLLLGDLLRRQGNEAAARAELTTYETAALQDLQAWAWPRFSTPPTSTLDIGNGLDLGFIQGFHTAEAASGLAIDWRWTTGHARLRLAVPAEGRCLVLHMGAGRPIVGAPVPVTLVLNGQPVERLAVAQGWQTYGVPLPNTVQRELIVELRSPTFTPRDYDRTSADGRTLGIIIDAAAVSATCP